MTFSACFCCAHSSALARRGVIPPPPKKEKKSLSLGALRMEAVRDQKKWRIENWLRTPQIWPGHPGRFEINPIAELLSWPNRRFARAWYWPGPKAGSLQNTRAKTCISESEPIHDLYTSSLSLVQRSSLTLAKLDALQPEEQGGWRVHWGLRRWQSRSIASWSIPKWRDVWFRRLTC